MAPGAVMLDLKGAALDQVEREVLAHPNVGGLIYFTRNYEDVTQIGDLTRQVREVRPEILIAVDHEGGRVQRFREGFSRIPPMAALGRAYDNEPHQALEQSRQLAWLLATELQAVGIDFSFAPVLDVDYGGSQVIGDRAFHQRPEAIVELATAFIEGMADAGMASTGKHFPGHGFVAEDSHIAKPVDKRSLEEIRETDLIPFSRLIAAGLNAVMPAHVVYEQVDQRPAGFSSVWVQQILRQQLGFNGVVFSDDLSMNGADRDMTYTERAMSALDAGCDMALVCNNAAAAEEVVEQLRPPAHWQGAQRLEQMRGKFHFKSMKELQQSADWQQAAQLAHQLITE